MLAKDSCGICPKPSVVEAEDCMGHTHRACEEHRRYLKGWLRDAESEQAAECAAARRFEREYE